MAVKIRLARRGRKKRALFDVVVADARAPRDGRFIEKIGTYNPNTDPASIELDNDKAFDWVMKGAQPTDTVRAMLSYRGILMKKHLQIGVIKGALTQEEADKKLEDWVQSKEQKIQGKIDAITKQKDAEKKARMEAETKVKEARAEALRKAQVVEEPAPEAEAATEDAAEATAEAAAAVEKAPQAEQKEETADNQNAEESAEESKEEKKD